MKKIFFLSLVILTMMKVQAQGISPIGVYEGKDKVSGMTRLGYLEINLDELLVPDFSQQFVKGQNHKFMLLPDNFQKKPSTHFKGQKATGFVKFQNRMLLVNTEICKLSNPSEGDNCWTLDWENEMGQKGKCTLYAPTDSTLLFIGLGSFSKSIGPDSLLFALNKERTSVADKQPYLTRKPRPQKEEESGNPSNPLEASNSSKPSSQIPDNVPEVLRKYKPSVPPTIKVPATNSGYIKGIWVGKLADGSVISIKLNSAAKSISYYGHKYYGLIRMDGPTFIEEGVVAVQKIGDAMYGLYTRSLNTDVSDIHYSVVAGYLKNILFFPTSATSAKNVMGRPASTPVSIYCMPPLPHFIPMCSTGKEVKNFPLDFYQKGHYNNREGEGVLCYGMVFTSFNMGRRTDEDIILEAHPDIYGVDKKNIRIKYKCGRTGNVYTAVLVYNPQKTEYKVTQAKMIKSESECPDINDCYLQNGIIGCVGLLRVEIEYKR